MRRLDWWLVLAVGVIAACATLAQRSTALALAAPGSVNRQLLWLAIGLGLMLAFSLADYRVLVRFAPLVWGASLLVLAALLVVAPLRAGTRSWLVLGPYTIQPSEFARVAALLAAAALAGEHREPMLDRQRIARLCVAVGAPAALVAAQPDLGMALTYVPLLLAALWLGGLPWRVWAGLVLTGAMLAGGAWAFYLKPYQKERVLTFVDSERDPYGAGYQQRQSKIAVGSGGLSGKGFHSGTQSQLRFLPAQRTDFIFAVWAEETGFVGSGILVGAYVLLLLRMFVVSLYARDRAGAMLAAGAGFVVAVQVIVNLAMVTGMAPTTGITLPLLSWGGSSVWATAITLGLVQSVWRLRFANV
ncbi:MAG TPA: rod shape-determining protein RodA [Thermoanaerobaculaceae bacterium]|nr:rod shape-determining protein RodA [Thermoanaerobaculaceae bacterium]HRS17147.1 rod shape-determining protein RodA [Thermoanaerobaculaceae bacterium]